MSNLTGFTSDTVQCAHGDLIITPIGHASVMLEHRGRVIHVDPVLREGDYAKLPKADLILVTHHHYDHLDPAAIDLILTDNTNMYCAAVCQSELPGGRVLENGQKVDLDWISIQAVPAYNIEHRRGDGRLFHPPGVGNGYVVSICGQRIYFAGDTENIPEMADLKNIDIAFLPMNLPYTMSPEMAADAAQVINPRILYPYHFSDTDLTQIVKLLQDTDIDVRLRAF